MVQIVLILSVSTSTRRWFEHIYRLIRDMVQLVPICFDTCCSINVVAFISTLNLLRQFAWIVFCKALTSICYHTGIMRVAGHLKAGGCMQKRHIQANFNNGILWLRPGIHF